MKTSKLILLLFIGVLAIQPVKAQNRSERKAFIEREVKEAVNSKQYKINVNHMLPMKGRSRSLTSNYSVEVRNDSVFSYLPYFGEAYNVPYGGGKGLIFNAPISQYQTKHLKKGKVQINFKVNNEEDKYGYNLTIYPNGSTSIHIQPTNRQAISFMGEMDVEE